MEWTMSVVNFAAPLTFTISYQGWYFVSKDKLPFGFVGGKMKWICYESRNLLATALPDSDKWTTNAEPSRNRIPLAHARPSFKLYCFSLKKTDMLKQWALQICFAVGFVRVCKIIPPYRVLMQHTTGTRPVFKLLRLCLQNYEITSKSRLLKQHHCSGVIGLTFAGLIISIGFIGEKLHALKVCPKI